MDLHLSGKTALVTGASKGIGLAITKALVDAGAQVVAGSRTRGDRLPALEEAGQVSFVPVDLSKPGAAEELVPNPGIADYCATKAAVANFAKALSNELAPKNIRVNAVSPGPVLTGLWTDRGGVADGFAEAAGQAADGVRAMIENSTPTGRFSTPEQVADLVVFLASDRAGNTTPSDYRIDGGFVTTL